ncbi:MULTISPECIES: hypothetical protein [Pseudomonas]|uniref:Uncharacterized protein n=1 Tax=Pseudomonas putida NBRC 14164 TaxID=1211579 RepID=A0ABN5UKT1_PSEPU|nr:MULTISPECIES: hypothetical protein [Pseudomonas]MCX9135597.1 hypothetical protein [Pseudomonas sp. DCB_PUT]MDD1969590.1 hypothetical protein [Pseudomonas putida]MDO1464820.1 hypothetical protein [Pseudomonas putida]MDO1470190.1 hypothetical protein [Pseudomonas putida]MDZ7325900.1 hypothetical protein [Pseudomonas sp. SDS3-8]
MAGLWEPVGGVYWKVPPDDVMPFLHWATVLVFAAVAVVAVAVRINRKRSEPEWHLRQHMVEIGAAATLTYLVGMTVLTWGRIGSLGEMPLNEVGDFLAGAFGPVAFLWLVLGFLQQGYELRMQATELKNSVEQHKEMVKTTKQERDRALKALFTFDVGSFIHSPTERWVRRKIRARNEGKKALNVVLQSDPHVNDGEPLELGDMPEGHQVTVAFDFPLLEGVTTGKFWIEYDDAVGGRRKEAFWYSTSEFDLSVVRAKADD